MAVDTKTAGAKGSRRPPTEKPTYRRSEMQALIQCNAYVNDHSVEAAEGTFVHEFIWRYWKHALAVNDESDWDAIDRIVTDLWLSRPWGIHPDSFDDLYQMCDVFARTHLAELDTLVALETTEPADFGWVIIHGTMDRIDRVMEPDEDPSDPPMHLKVTDYKTDRGKVRGDDEPHKFQGRTYAQILFAKYPHLQYVTTAFDYLKLRGGPIEVTYERGVLDGWWTLQLEALRARVTQPKQPTGCVACQFCRMRMDCAAGLTEYQRTPSSREELELLGQEWNILEAARTTRRKTLETAFLQRPAMVIGGFEMGNLPPRQEKWVVTDKLEVQKQVMAANLPDPMYIAIDKSMVPAGMKRGLVGTGAAKYDLGPPSFKRRTATVLPATEEETLLDRLIREARMEAGETDDQDESETE